MNFQFNIILIFTSSNLKFKVTCKNANFECPLKEIESPCDLMPPYKLIGYHGINRITLIRGDDMYKAFPLS